MRVAMLSQDAFYYQEEQLERVVSRANPEIIFYNYNTIKAVCLYLIYYIYFDISKFMRKNSEKSLEDYFARFKTGVFLFHSYKLELLFIFSAGQG